MICGNQPMSAIDRVGCCSQYACLGAQESCPAAPAPVQGGVCTPRSKSTGVTDHGNAGTSRVVHAPVELRREGAACRRNGGWDKCKLLQQLCATREEEPRSAQKYDCNCSPPHPPPPTPPPPNLHTHTPHTILKKPRVMGSSSGSAAVSTRSTAPGRCLARFSRLGKLQEGEVERHGADGAQTVPSSWVLDCEQCRPRGAGKPQGRRAEGRAPQADAPPACLPCSRTLQQTTKSWTRGAARRPAVHGALAEGQLLNRQAPASPPPSRAVMPCPAHYAH